MKEIYQKQLHELVSRALSEQSNTEEFETYQSVLGVVFSLIEDNNLEKLDTVLRLYFPAYYNTPVPLIMPEN